MVRYTSRTAATFLIVFACIAVGDSSRAFAEPGPPSVAAPVGAGFDAPAPLSTAVEIDAKSFTSSSRTPPGTGHQRKRLSLKATLIIVGVAIGTAYLLLHALVP